MTKNENGGFATNPPLRISRRKIRREPQESSGNNAGFPVGQSSNKG